MSAKIRLGILCGGKSAEHEVSLNSARNVFQAVERKRFEPILVGLDRSNVWHILDSAKFIAQKDEREIVSKTSMYGKILCLPGEGGTVQLISADSAKKVGELEVVFPVLHGSYGEDGCMQGYLKLLGVPFVGPSVLGSAVGMDKEVMKRLLVQAQIPSAKFVAMNHTQRKALSPKDIIAKLGLPCFVKPANLGSSVGISKAKSEEELQKSLDLAFQYDNKIIIEECIVGREIECAVLGNENAEASIPGEVIPAEKHGFYSYDAKYTDAQGARLEVPAKLSPEIVKRVQELAILTFKTLECEGLSRVDVFLKANGELLVNELNTIPGFTNISMYPKMWEASGISYSNLISKLVDLALERSKREAKLNTSYF